MSLAVQTTCNLPRTNKLDDVPDRHHSVVAQSVLVPVKPLHVCEIFVADTHNYDGQRQLGSGHQRLAGVVQVWSREGARGSY